MSTKHIASTTAMALCLAVLSLPAGAQEAAPSDALYLGRIVIGYAPDGTPIYAGESTTSLDEDDIGQKGGVAGLNSVLRSQTSVYTQMDIGNPGIAVNIRGFEGSGRVAASIDGIPQNYRITGHTAQSALFVDPNLVAGIDITRGAVITTGGSGIAGSVNFRTISADDVVRDGKTWGSIVRLSYGDNGDRKSGMVGSAYKDDRFSAIFALSRNLGDNYEDGSGKIVNNSWDDNGSGLIKFGYNIDDRQEINFAAIRYDAQFHSVGYIQEVGVNTYSLGYKFDAGDGLVDLNVNLYHSENDVTWLSGGAYNGRNMTTTTKGFNATNISEVSLGAWELTSINGIDWSRDILGGGASGGVNPVSGEATRFALFSENIFTSGNWEITAGLRGNTYNLESSGGQGSIDKDFSSIDPKLTVAYTFNDWFQPFATISKTTRVPTLQEVMLGGTHPGGGVGMVGNPELEPEESKGIELGFNIAREGLFTAGDFLRGRINYYRMDVENYITASYPSSITNAWGNTGIAFINQPGTAETSGFEVELDYTTGKFDFGLAYTRNDSKMPGQTPGLGAGQYLPDSTLSLNAAVRLLGDQLTLGANYNFTSGGLYNALYNNVAVQRDQSYETVDLFAVYDVNENFQINAKIENVLDKTYIPWLSMDENGPGRSAYIGAEIRF